MNKIIKTLLRIFFWIFLLASAVLIFIAQTPGQALIALLMILFPMGIVVADYNGKDIL